MLATPHRIFADGPDGRLHAIAHRCLEQGRHEEGRRALAGWDRVVEATDDRAVHLYWHQLVFDLALGDLGSAAAGFERHIRPAMGAGRANTDGPQALWRLSLAGIDPGPSAWREARDAVRAALRGPASPYVRLHAALCFAGARDDAGLRGLRVGEREPVLREAVAGLHELSTGRGAGRLAGILDALPAVGGSRAQNALFGAIVDHIQAASRAAA